MPRTHRSLYRFELHHPTEGLLADLSPYTTSRSFELILNRAEKVNLSLNATAFGSLMAKFNTNPSAFLGAGVNKIIVWRGNRPIFGTRVRYIRPSVDESGETLEVRATGYLDDFSHRYLLPVLSEAGGVIRYTNANIGAIIWNMIDTTQGLTNGDIGFTQGVIQTSRNMTDDWQPYTTSLKDIFIRITERFNSVDFDFSYDQKLNVYYPRQGRVQDNLRLSYPGNINGLAAPEDASQLVNVSINRGSGNGLDITPIRTRPNLSSQQKYGRMERIDDYSDVSVETTLDDFGDETLRAFSSPLVIPEISLKSGQAPPLGAYWIGDWLPISIPNRPLFAQVHNTNWRVLKINANLNDLDTEDVRLTVATQ